VDDAGWFFTITWRLSAKIAEELGGNTSQSRLPIIAYLNLVCNASDEKSMLT
jgi:hypothetical protein